MFVHEMQLTWSALWICEFLCVCAQATATKPCPADRAGDELWKRSEEKHLVKNIVR